MVFPHFSSPIFEYEDIDYGDTRTLLVTKMGRIMGIIKYRHKRYVFIPHDTDMELTHEMLDDIGWVIDRLNKWEKGILD